MTKKGIYSVEKICEKFLMRLKNLYKVLLTLMVDARIIIWRASKIKKNIKNVIVEHCYCYFIKFLCYISR